MTEGTHSAEDIAILWGLLQSVSSMSLYLFDGYIEYRCESTQSIQEGVQPLLISENLRIPE